MLIGVFGQGSAELSKQESELSKHVPKSQQKSKKSHLIEQ